MFLKISLGVKFPIANVHVTIILICIQKNQIELYTKRTKLIIFLKKLSMKHNYAPKHT